MSIPHLITAQRWLKWLWVTDSKLTPKQSGDLEFLINEIDGLLLVAAAKMMNEKNGGHAMPRLIQVIESEIQRGEGTSNDPTRTVTQYHTPSGQLLAEADPWLEVETLRQALPDPQKPRP